MEDLYEDIWAAADVEIEKDLTLSLNMERQPTKMLAEKMQNLGFTPKLTLIDSYVNGSLDVGFTLNLNIMPKAEFLGLKGSSKEEVNNSYVHDAFQEGSIFVRAAEDINIGLQLEVVLQAGAELFCAFWLTPTPEPIGVRRSHGVR